MKSTSGTRLFKRSLAALAVSSLLGLASSAYAADTSNIVGSVKGISAAGVTIKVKNPKTGFDRTIAVDNTGSFRFSQLPIGDYEIEVLSGSTVVAKDKVRLSMGSNAVAAFDVNKSSDTEVIQVSGARIQAVDVTTADSGLVIGEVEFDKMPVARNITAVSLEL